MQKLSEILKSLLLYFFKTFTDRNKSFYIPIPLHTVFTHNLLNLRNLRKILDLKLLKIIVSSFHTRKNLFRSLFSRKSLYKVLVA